MNCTYVGLYGSGLFNFGSYVNLPTLRFAYFLGFDVLTSSSIFIENFILVFIVFFLNGVNIFVDCRNTGVSYISYEIIQS